MKDGVHIAVSQSSVSRRDDPDWFSPGPCEWTFNVRFHFLSSQSKIVRTSFGSPDRPLPFFFILQTCPAHTITTATATATMTILISTPTKAPLTSSTRPFPLEPSPPSTPLPPHTPATSSSPGPLASSTLQRTHLNTSRATPMTSSFYASLLKVASSSSRFFSRLVQAI